MITRFIDHWFSWRAFSLRLQEPCGQQLEVGLLADHTLGGEHTRPGDVLGVELNCRGRGYASSGLAGELGGRAGEQFAAGRSILESFGDFFAVVVPPLRPSASLAGSLSLSAMASCPFLHSAHLGSSTFVHPAPATGQRL